MRISLSGNLATPDELGEGQTIELGVRAVVRKITTKQGEDGADITTAVCQVFQLFAVPTDGKLGDQPPITVRT